MSVERGRGRGRGGGGLRAGDVVRLADGSTEGRIERPERRSGTDGFIVRFQWPEGARGGRRAKRAWVPGRRLVLVREASASEVDTMRDTPRPAETQPISEETRQRISELDDALLCDLIRFMLDLLDRRAGVPRPSTVEALTDEVKRRVAERESVIYRISADPMNLPR